jgi:MFS family permease
MLATASLVFGYVNTLLTQTITFAADEFHSSDGAQGVALAVVRVGVLLSLGLVVVADRRGRRKVILACLVIAPIFSALGAAAPGLVWLTATQFIGRPAGLALGLVIDIVCAEEMPKGSRAYAIALTTMAAGLGAGICVVALPLADLGIGGWRLVYLLPLAFLPLVPGIGRRLPESRRFIVHRATGPTTLRGHRRRFWLLAASGLLVNLLIAPASGFQNRYLSKTRGYPATLITAFTLVTSAPGAIGIVAGGRLAERGRRRVGAVALVGGAAGTVASFFVGGPAMWLFALGGSLMAGAAVPALEVYGPELFPTSLRGRASGGITVLALAGSAIGLVAAGWMLDGRLGFGPVMGLLGVGPLLVAGLVITSYPETAHLELEQINPEDAVAPATPPTA